MVSACQDDLRSLFSRFSPQLAESRHLGREIPSCFASLLSSFFFFTSKMCQGERYGIRQNPSARVVQRIAQALGLQEHERQELYHAFTQLTGQPISKDQWEQSLPDIGYLAQSLVRSSAYPAHALDRLWYIQSWNEAALTL